MATMTESSTISILNNLIETCRDGEEGFRTASENVQNAELKSLFSAYSRGRGQLIQELQREVAKLGGPVENQGSVAGSVHRGWINLKAAISGKDEKAIVSECERGEDVAKKAYENAIKSPDIPAALKSLIQKQYVQVKEAHDNIRNIERSYEK